MKKENGILEEVHNEDLKLLKENPTEFWKDVSIIGVSAFILCSELDEIEIPSSIKQIMKNAFMDSNVSKIMFNEGLEEIDEGVFNKCKNIKSIELPSTLKRIKNKAFSHSGLQIIKLNEGLKELYEGTFSFCPDIEKIVFPSTMKKIESGAFWNCGVKEIRFNYGLTSISDSAFLICKKLEKIELPITVKEIGDYTFAGCSGVKEISIPKGTISYRNSFASNAVYERIYVYDIDKIAYMKWAEPYINNEVDDDINSHYTIYYNEDTKQYLIQNDNVKYIPKGFKRYSDIDSYVETLNCNNSSAISLCLNNISLEELNSKKLIFKGKFIFSKLIENNEINKLKDMYSGKEFMKMLERIEKIDNNQTNIYELIKLAFNLGAFEKDDIVRQKACNFIENLFDKGMLDFKKVGLLFSELNIEGYNKEWAEFFMNKKNIVELLNMPLDSEFVSRTYNDFESVKRFNTSNRGEQRQLKVTMEAYARYFSKVAFSKVDETTADISEILSKFTRNQESFDDAALIRKEYLKLKDEGKLKDHLIDEEIKEKDIFDSIDEVRKETISNISRTIESLNYLASKKFTYEFLSKYDPRNFVLGKYCSCCSHVEGAGFGIMKGSILNPDCQNIVIKDKNGEIISKSTLYVNREQGYGVLNNIEVSSFIKKEDKELIYNKYILAIQEFVEKYNKINPHKQITQINVGMHSNDLEEQIHKYNSRGEILNGVDFSLYGKRSLYYGGDWKNSQYVIWKK